MKRKLQIINKNRVSFMRFPIHAKASEPYRVSVFITDKEMDYLQTIIHDENLVDNFCYNIG